MEAIGEIHGPKEIYRYYKERNRCVRCHKQDAYTLNGRSRCAECAEKDSERHRRNYTTENNNKKCQKFRKKCKENGLCTTCGRPAVQGKVRCTECLLKCRKATAAYRASKGEVNLPRGDNGICWKCNKKPVVDGKKMCPDCLEKARRTIDNNRVKRWGGNHIWKRLPI